MTANRVISDGVQRATRAGDLHRFYTPAGHRPQYTVESNGTG